MSNPRPSLNQLEQELFGPDWDLIEKWRKGDSLPDDVVYDLERSSLAQWMLDELNDLAEEKLDKDTVSEQQQQMSPPPYLGEIASVFHALGSKEYQSWPEPGQIVVFDSLQSPIDNKTIDIRLNRSLAVLLVSHGEDENIWSGWVVAPEAEIDYAGEWDVLLEEVDQPYLPSLAGMVQVWNTVDVHTGSITRVIGKLSPERLHAIHETQFDMLMEGVTFDKDSELGKTRQISIGGQVLTTGIPLKDRDDVRMHYQMMYAQVAEVLKEPARMLLKRAAELEPETAADKIEVDLESKPIQMPVVQSWIDKLRDFLPGNPVLVPAMAMLLFAFVAIPLLLNQQPGLVPGESANFYDYPHVRGSNDYSKVIESNTADEELLQIYHKIEKLEWPYKLDRTEHGWLLTFRVPEQLDSNENAWLKQQQIDYAMGQWVRVEAKGKQ